MDAKVLTHPPTPLSGKLNFLTKIEKKKLFHFNNNVVQRSLLAQDLHLSFSTCKVSISGVFLVRIFSHLDCCEYEHFSHSVYYTVTSKMLHILINFNSNYNNKI